MHIKHLQISGFRSFRAQEKTADFSPQHNCIVGRNGSGKSNFFKAIQFVLLNQRYMTLHQEDRQQLLHEGAGANVMSAFVEVTFDNSDGRLAQDGDEVTLRRTVGLKKDEFFLSGRRVTKQEVSALLESAGFSKSNPYYIVQQGKMSALSEMAPAERLSLLQEVAGTKVYEERRVESLDIMTETNMKRESIQEVIDYIEQRLAELEEEKAELGNYQQLDKERRALEYTLYDKELCNARDEIEATEHSRLEGLERANGVHLDHRGVTDGIAERLQAVAAVEARVAKAEAERGGADKERKSLVSRKTKLALQVKEMQERVAGDAEAQVSLQRELSSLQADIEQQEGKLRRDVQPTHDKAQKAHSEAERALAEAETEGEELYAKRSRHQHFHTKEERDAHLQKQIEAIDKAGKEKRKAVKKLQEGVAKLKAKLEASETKSKEMESEVGERHEQIGVFARELTAKRDERGELAELRKDRWRELEKLQERSSELKASLSKAERDLRASMPRHIAQGLEAVEKIVREQKLPGYFGPLIENLTLKDPNFAKAVEVAAGNSLFHVLVDTDETAALLMRKLQEGRLGRVTFMPLNRLSERNKTVKYPDAEDVMPLLQLAIKYDPRAKPAMEQVFNKKLLARSPEVAAEFARTSHMDCITLEGDEVGRKGGLTGGYRDERNSRLLAMHTIRESRKGLKEVDASIKALNAKITETDQAVTTIMGTIQKTEAQRDNMRRVIEQHVTELGAAKQERRAMEEQRAKKEEDLPALQAEAQQVQLRADALRQELGTPLEMELSPAEQQRLTELNTATIPSLRAALSDTFAVLEASSAARQRILSLLQDNLHKRREEVLDLLAPEHGGVGSSVGSGEQERRAEALDTKRQELSEAERRLSESEARLGEADETLQGGREDLRGLQEELEQLRAREARDSESLLEASKHMEKLLNKKALFVHKRDECVKKIQELGSLPAQELSKHTGRSIKQMMKKLKEVNEKLKKYSHVNKKALDQYISFSEQRGNLLERKREADDGAKAIKDLVTALDRQKDEAILRTFKGVSHHFTQVFSELVPTGHGQLVMKTRSDAVRDEEEEEEDDEEEEEESEEEDDENEDTGNGSTKKKKKAKAKAKAKGKGKGKGKGKAKGKAKAKKGGAGLAISEFVGVEVKVSFQGSGKTYLMSQLSGGQKALVSLAIIFAIQRCDPAPFYLFDEIDEALDPTYRAAVAALIQRQAQSADNPTQFITTTFKPEQVRVASQCYGMSYQNRVSHIDQLPTEDALGFLLKQRDEEETVGHQMQPSEYAKAAAKKRGGGRGRRRGEEEEDDEDEDEEGEEGGKMDMSGDEDEDEEEEEEEEDRRTAKGRKRRR